MPTLTSEPQSIPIAPIRADFVFCNDFYDVGIAGMKLPVGITLVDYTVHGNPNLYNIPFQVTYLDATIWIDLAPSNVVNSLPQGIVGIIHDDIRGMVGWLEHNCVSLEGKGGFTTKDIGALVNHQLDSQTRIPDEPYPLGTVFVTATVVKVGRENPPGPGDRGPQLPRRSAEAALDRCKAAPSYLKLDYWWRAQFFAKQAKGMVRGGDIAW